MRSGKDQDQEATHSGTKGRRKNEVAEDPAMDPTPLLDAARAERERIGRFNLAIVGGTGVGKSSLLNAIFGEDRAETGVGMPVTKGITYHVDEAHALGIWDFEGFEIGSQVDPAQRIRQNLQTIAAGPPEQQIAVVWYCVLSTSSRLTQPDIDMIRAFAADGLHVIVVLTKVARVKNHLTNKWTVSDDAAKMLAFLADPEGADGRGEPLDLPVAATVLTAAVDQGKFGGPRHGLAELLTTTLDLSRDSAQDAFRVAQQLSLPMKRELARRAIKTAVASSVTAAMVPIPFADAVVLAPIQLGMMGKISTVYGIDLKVVFSAQALAQLATQFAGRALVRSALKVIPGIGSVINASVAGALTAASGEAWMRLCEAIHTGAIQLDNIERLWREYEPSAMQILTEFLRTKGRSASR